jgi:cyanophycin synthetase
VAGYSAATLVELRVLDGPNLYFTRPAIKLTLGITGWLTLSEPWAAEQAARFELLSRVRSPGTD